MGAATLFGTVGLAVAALALSACGGRADAAPSTVVLTIRHSHFVPDAFRARPGSTVTIVVRNEDPIDHELIVGDQAVQDRHEHGTDAHHDGSVPGEVSVPAETEARTVYTFPPSGTILYGCHLPGHYAYGMHGRVVLR